MTEKISGEIGYYELGDWWLSTFTQSERERMIAKFAPMGGSTCSLAKGPIIWQSQTVVGFLGSLASWFSSSEDLPLAYRIIQKAESLVDVSNYPLDAHFLFGQKIKTYQFRRVERGTEQIYRGACQSQIEIADQAAAAFRKEYPGALPLHPGYEGLAVVFVREKNFQKAVELCRHASSQGWVGDWSRRIERCEDRLKKAAK